MDCEEAKLKMNALIDNEIDEKDVPGLISHLESCYKCRDEYIELLKLQKKMKGVPIPQPNPEWFEDMPGRIFRKVWSLTGKILFIGSYILLLAYSLYNLFTSSDTDLFLKIVIGGVVLGLFVLFGISLSDRIRESKTDRYKGVMK